MGLLISLIAGALGGNIAGAVLKKFNLGFVGNSAAGILGGGLGGQLIAATGASAVASSDIGAIISQIASGGVGGGLVMVLVGLIRSVLVK